MYPFVYFAVFAAMCFLFIVYQYDSGYEFGMLGPVVKFLERILRRKVTPLMAAIFLISLLIVELMAIRWLMMLAGEKIEYIFGPLFIAECWYFFRALGFSKILARKLGRVGAEIVQLIFASILGLAWIILPLWFTYNAIAFILITLGIRVIGPIKLRFLLAMLVGFVLYDVWGVFITNFIVDVAMTMKSTGGGFMIPLVVVVPGSSMALGLGDITSVGIILTSVMEAEESRSVSASKYRLELTVYAGFVVGLGVALSVLTIFKRPLPAMVFLAPCVIVLLQFVSKRYNIKLNW